MGVNTTWECVCGREFDSEDEAEEHVAYNHDPFDEYLSVVDERNRVEPEGL